jgi:hypothetical protein
LTEQWNVCLSPTAYTLTDVRHRRRLDAV